MLGRRRVPRRRDTSLLVLASNAGWMMIGAGLGLANTVRHRLTGYRNPRPFGPGDIARDVRYSLEVVDGWRQHGLEPAGLHILELGPGPDLGTGFVLVALGAASYTAVDRFPLANRVDPAFYQALAERLGADVDVTMQRMQYFVGERSASNVPPGGFDAFVSNATLEHLDDVGSEFAWMASVGASGARHVHLVDPKTHMRWVRSRDPWNILRYPAWFYRVALSFPGAPNRMLPSDYVAEASRASIRLAVVDGLQIDSERLRRVRRYLARDYRTRADADLRLLTFTLIGQQVESSPAAERMHVGSSSHAG
jgi:hypothetical protein